MVSPPKEEWLDNGLIRHNLPAPRGLIEVDTVLDIGAGIRPMNWYKPKQHICVDPYDKYCQILSKAGYHVLGMDAETALIGYLQTGSTNIDAIYLLDVIEHMEKDQAHHVVELSQEVAKKQIVIFTPFGFMEQSGDAWGLGGDSWQTHRSGWLPDDFANWHTYRYAKGFYAIWSKQ